MTYNYTINLCDKKVFHVDLLNSILQYQFNSEFLKSIEPEIYHFSDIKHIELAKPKQFWILNTFLFFLLEVSHTPITGKYAVIIKTKKANKEIQLDNISNSDIIILKTNIKKLNKLITTGSSK